MHGPQPWGVMSMPQISSKMPVIKRSLVAFQNRLRLVCEGGGE